MQLSPGAWLVIIGVALALLGVVLMTGALDWFGRLPGDVRIERGNTRIYIPISSMIIVSVALTVLVQLVMRFFR